MQDHATRLRATSAVQPDEAPWPQFSSRWALLTSGAVVALTFVYMVGVGLDEAVPMYQTELVAAGRGPAIYGLAAGLDILVWLGIGGFLLAFAGAAAPRAPIRAALLAACGLGQLTGVLGGFLKLTAVSDLGARYAAAAPDQQAALLHIQQTLFQVITAHFNAGQLLYGAGYLLIAWVALSFGGLPRWIVMGLALSGTYAVLNQAAVVATGGLLPEMLFMLFQVVDLVLYLGIAAALWRRAPAAMAVPKETAASVA